MNPCASSPPTEIERVAWEGYLEPLGQTFRSASLPRVTLGEPEGWPAAEAMESRLGQKWTPPAAGRRYTLVRLACTLHPPSDKSVTYSEATLTAYLRPRAGAGRVVAHDLYPQRQTVESKGKLALALKPNLKFAAVAEAGLEAGVEIEHHDAFPVITGFGLGESNPYWQFARHAASPLIGCQSVYVVLDTPLDADGVRLSLELIASLETRYGPLRAGLPEAARAHLSRAMA